ncbi:MAG: LCP family protein [Candidatus Doudnabacteria bacterium]|nr:LCP family protein [bacterium]MDZ4244038.1 LCP family protein [Candidatus Doudnabacteria bacterium]
MIDSLDQKKIQNFSPKRKRPRSYFRVFVILLGFALLGSGIFVGSKLVIFAQKVFEGSTSFFSFKQLFLAEDKKLIGEEDGQIRILLMGIGGQGHDGATLTDTMILATIKLPQEKDEEVKVGTISIPRDLVVNIPGGYNYRRINTAYANGEAGGKKEGPQLAIQTVEAMLGVKIPYYGVLDFQGFQKIIDDIGGIEVNVEQGFTDSQFPDEKQGYLAPVTFQAGPEKMDGERALQFVRSRHGTNNEGSDFARAKRQQKVLKSVKDKVTNLKVLTNLGTLNNLLEDLSDHVRTNLAPYELLRVYNLTEDIPNENISSLAIDGGLVCDQIEEGTSAYVLIPCDGLGRYSGIRGLVHNQFLLSALQNEKPIIEIQNASSIPQLGQRTQNLLALPGLQFSLGNFRGQNIYQESIIYDNTNGQKPETLAYLKERLGLKVAGSPFPFLTVFKSPDFVIVSTNDLAGRLP